MQVVVATPAWRAFEGPNVSSVMDLLTHPNVARLPLTGDADIVRVRSRGATRFLEQTTADVLLWVDSDISFRDTDALLVCRQAMEHSIVAGIYVTRSSRSPILTSRLLRDVRVNFGTDPTPAPILWAAGGFTAVHRRVYERLADDPEMAVLHPDDPALRMRPFYLEFPTDDEDGNPIWLSEDWAFAERARRAGFPSYASPSVRLAHWGVYGFSLEDVYAKHPDPAPLAVTRTAAGTLVEHD